jgi:hypothetical protein
MSLFYFTPKTLIKNVATAGTQVPLFAASTPCHSCTIQADPGNAGVVYIGDLNVSSSAYGISLAAGTYFSFSCDGNDSKIDLADVWVDSAQNDENVSVFYF